MALSIRFILTIALICLGIVRARANDLPVKGNLAAQEALDIERGVYAVPETSKARAHVFSIFARQLTWQSGVLKACFWNGDTDMQARISGIADELVAKLPVKFQWRENGAIAKCAGGMETGAPWRGYTVRVSLNVVPSLLKSGDNASAFFALLGQQTRTDRRATVNLPFNADDSDSEIRNRTLHEFCHVLGCMHEHQRDLCAKDFDESKIRAKFSLSAEDYRNNFLTIPSGHAYGPIISSVFDDKSVMLYRLTQDMFVAGSVSKCIVGTPASKLSQLDEIGLEGAYQRAAATPGLRLDDFPKFEKQFRSKALAQRMLANRLRTMSLQWQSRVKAFNFDGTADAVSIEAVAMLADTRAVESEAEADSYALTASQVAAIKKALSYFSADETSAP